ncbi:LysR family transcriptional regulator [Shimia sp.]|uniref:LysR family transcriptional regulator n=1 Tax=Shimia sp. TaxID=1954381 RepID=UPI0032983D10
MKLRQLEFAREIARTGSFSHAADVCNATQPTLSNALGQLEDELGAKIFHRTTRSVELTPYGGYVLPYLEAILEARDEMAKASEAYLHPEHKVLRIGLSPLVDMGLLNEVLEPYRRENPDVSVYFKECLLDDLAGRMDTGSVDIAVVPRDMIEAGWDHLRFYADPLFYIPSDGTDIPVGRNVTVASLPASPIIMTGGGCGLNRSLERLFVQNAANFTPYPGAAISYPVIEQWAGIGIGAGILPRAKLSGAKDTARALLSGDGAQAAFEFHWVWKTDLAFTSHVTALHDHITRRVPLLVSGRLAEAVP